MPVFPSFVPLVSDNWVQLCQYNELRKSLTLQVSFGVAILSPTTAGPMVDTIVGSMPAGIWNSPDTGTGPTYFTVNEGADHDLVKQAWFGWTHFPKQNEQPLSWQHIVVTGTPPFAAFVVNPVLPFVALFVHTVATGSPVVSVTSGRLGTLTPAVTDILPDGITDFSRTDLYFFQPGANDNITIRVDINASCNAYVSQFNASFFPLGQSGSQGVGFGLSNASNVVTMTTFQNSIVIDEPCVVVCNSRGPAVSFTYAGNIKPTFPGNMVTNAVVSGDGTAWIATAVISQVTAALVPIAVTFTFNAVNAANAGSIWIWKLPSPRIMTVLESLDVIVPPEPPKMFTVSLPKLSPDAMAALKDLVSRVQGSQAEPEGLPNA